MRRKEKLDVEADCAWMWSVDRVGVAPIWNFKCAEIVAIERYDSVDKAIESCPITPCKYLINFHCACQFSSICGGPRTVPGTVIFSASGVVNFGHFAHFALIKSAMIYGVHLTPSLSTPLSPLATNLSAAEFTQKRSDGSTNRREIKAIPFAA